jgi:hydrogenase maturation protease
MVAPAAGDGRPRVLVACVGNVLRGDDGFGVAVAAQLHAVLPEGTDLIETGIGGLDIIHQLMDGYHGLIIVDAVERAAQPGTVFVLVPQLPDVATPTFEQWRAQLADFHLAEPSRVLRLARAAGILPEHVLVVGCQPETCEDFEDALSSHVAAAVPVAARRVRELAVELLATLRRCSRTGGAAAADNRGSSGCRGGATHAIHPYTRGITGYPPSGPGCTRLRIT